MKISSSTTSERPAGFMIGALLLAYFLLRLALVWRAPSIFCVPQELYQGFIAFDWLHGLKTSLLNYQVDPYTAGSIVVGTLAAPLFKILGPSLFALKMVPLLFSTGALFWILRTLNDHFNRETVMTAGLLLIFASPGLSFLSAIALGSHPESVFFAAMITFYCLRTLTRPFSILNLAMWGLASGLGFWFAHVNIAAIMTSLLICLFIRPSHQSARNAVIWAAAFFAGFSPWFVYNLTHQWMGVNFLSEALQPSIPSLFPMLKSIAGEFLRTVFFYFPQSLFYRSQFGMDFTLIELVHAGFLFSLYFLFAGHFFIRLRQGHLTGSSRTFFPQLFFLLFPLLFALFFAYARHSFPWHAQWNPYRFRYLTPLLFFSIIPAAIAAGQYRCGKWLIGALLALGMVGQYQAFSFPSKARSTELTGFYLEHPKRIFDYRPRGIPEKPEQLKPYLESLDSADRAAKISQLMYHDAFWGWPLEPAYRNSLAQELSLNDRKAFYTEWGRAAGTLIEAPWETILNAPDDVPVDYRDNYMYGISMSLSWRESPSFRTILGFISRQPVEYQPLYFLTSGSRIFTWTTLTGTPKRISPGIWPKIRGLDTVSRTWLMRGTGRGLLWTVGNPAHLEIALKNFRGLLTEQDKANILWGMGWQLQRLEVSRDVLAGFNQTDAQEIMKGYEANKRWEQDPKMKLGDLYGA